MNRQATLRKNTLELRALTESDRAGLFEAASDPITWAGHPNSDRWKPDVFTPYFDALLASRETLAICHDDKIIGCSRYYTPHEDAEGIAIGFTFLHHSHWGGTMNRRVKSLMLDHAFESHTTVWFHIAPSNIRSQKATAKLGAVLVSQGENIVCGTAGLWMAYALTKSDWRSTAHL